MQTATEQEKAPKGIWRVIAASTAGTMIVFESVTKVYDPNVVALNDVSFVIAIP